MRFGVLAAVLALSSSARAGWLETSGFAGVEALPSDVRLGNSSDAEQRPQTGPELGARVAWIAAPVKHLELGVEAELAFTPTWTGYGFGANRASDFAPVIGYRGSLVLRFSDYAAVKPHVLAGAGGASVITGSPYAHDTSDPQLYYGIGATIELGGDVQLRIDGRQGWLPTRGGEGATYELLLGVGTTFGRPTPVDERTERAPELAAATPSPLLATPAAPQTRTPATPQTPTPAAPQTPTPAAPQTPTPGAPPAPPPAAMPTSAAPSTPASPDPLPPAPARPADSDGDGIPDAQDRCPTQPETFNGFEDEDGCPDVIPDAITAALAAARAARFEPKHARVTDAAAAALEPALGVLRTHPRLHLDIIAHAAADDPGGELATKRADAVKWHFVDHGIPTDQLAIIAGAPQSGADPAPIELALHAASAPHQ